MLCSSRQRFLKGFLILNKMMQLKKATRKQVKLRLNISAPSGAGKTYSALRMAKGLCNDWSKVAVIDTENGSASLYSHLGDYNTIDLSPPFTPEKYTEALQLCEQSGIEVVIIDSSSHEWTTLLEQNETLAHTSFRGNTWAAWSKSTPRHDKFVNSVLHSPCHVITCTRSKTETIQEGGKVKKVGMKDLQRDGWEYELTISLNLDRDTHLAIPSKDRTNLFEGKQPFLISEKTGELIKEWCESGVSELQMGLNEMEIVASIDSLKTVWSKYKSLQSNIDFIAMKDKRKLELEQPEENTQEEIQKEIPTLTDAQFEKTLNSTKATMIKALTAITNGTLNATQVQTLAIENKLKELETVNQ